MILTYQQLTEAEQAQAKTHWLAVILQATVEGEMPPPDRAAFDRCVAKMERLQTPWFLAETVMEDAGLKNALLDSATANAENALYSTPDSPPVLSGIAGPR